jgi:ATP-dependent DNA ligase
MALLADVVAASDSVAGTSSRASKVATLAELLRALEGGEVPIATGLLSGVPRQGRVGVGHSTIYGLEHETAAAPSLTIGELDAAIAELQATTGSGSAARRRVLLERLLGRATTAEAAFIRRLFTGELRQGALAGVMVDAIAKAAEVPLELARRAYMLSGDLTRTARVALVEGDDGLRAIGFELFRPVLPMLAAGAESIAEALAGFERVSVEWKLDGIRIQIHRRGHDVRVYTRNLNDVTHDLAGSVDAALQLPAQEVVLDGEALGGGTFLFDLLHVDGEDLLDTPLERRQELLAALAPELKVPGTFTSDAGEAELVLDEALAAGHEGVVVKDAASLYAAGRRGRAWRKVKPVRTYDLVVLGAEWGHGRRQGTLSNLHLGARDPRSGGFLMVGKTFKGMTDELLRWQTRKLLAREVERRGIAVLVRPELVVEIALDGVQSSTRYPGGVALRFARVKRYRPDKDAAEADTIDALRALLRQD